MITVAEFKQSKIEYLKTILEDDITKKVNSIGVQFPITLTFSDHLEKDHLFPLAIRHIVAELQNGGWEVVLRFNSNECYELTIDI
jgi:hypothetical protein